MAVVIPAYVDGIISRTAWVPWVLLLTTFALWGFWSIISNLFGGLAARSANIAAAAGGAAVGGAPGAAAGAAITSPWYGRTHDTTRALRDLLWLLLIPILINTFFGWEHRARDLIIAIFAIGIVWAFLRGLLHRFADVLWIPLIALAIAAAGLGIRHRHFDD
jgi:hypothetical protein